jgi:hypothetical protein
VSSFNCDQCGKPIIDTDRGYVTECEHHKLPIDHGPQKRPANIRQIITGQVFIERQLNDQKPPKR